jgi:DNA-binding MarR family transcriptional regulator
VSTKAATHKPTPARREETVTRQAPAKPFSVPVAARTSEDARFDRLVYELKALFEVSDGNLSAHARKLEEAGYIACSKSFEGRRPKSEYRLTAVGRKALYRYLEHIEAVIKATRRA